MKPLLNTLLRFSQRGYYLSFLAIIVAVAAGFLLAKQVHFNKASETGIAFQSVVFMLLLVTLPGIFWWFNRQVQALRKLPEIAKKELKYRRLIALRFCVVNFNIVLNILLFFFFADKSFFMCTAIAAIFLLFCRPSAGNIEKDLGLVKEEPEDE